MGHRRKTTAVSSCKSIISSIQWFQMHHIITFSTIYEPVHEKTNNLGFRPGLTQTRLYSHRSRLEARNFRFKKKRDCSSHVAKTKALISFAVTAKLICGFVFAYANCWFSHAQAHIIKP